jgi:predicted PurR-regulated permease PerM
VNASAARNALIIMAVIACGAALLWLRDILTPLALALFLMVMIDGLARVLYARLPSLSRKAAIPLSVLIFTVGFLLMSVVVVENAAAFGRDVAGQTARIDAVLQGLAGMVGVKEAPTVQQLLRQLNPSAYLGLVAGHFQNVAAVISQVVFVFIYLGFLLASRVGFQAKAERLFSEPEEMEHASQVFKRIRDGIERYLWIQTVTGLMIAGASWLLLQVLGVQSAFFWAFLIFIASYIPIVGGFVGIALPPLYALVQFPTYWQAAVILGALYTVHFVVGNIVQPRMQGQSLNVDPVVVLLALALWGALWGVPGMFLSTPLTVMLMVILAQFRNTRWLAILLSGDGRPEKLSDGPADPSKPPALPGPPPRVAA